MSINKIADISYYSQEFAEGMEVISAFDGLVTPDFLTVDTLDEWANGDYSVLENLNDVSLRSYQYTRKVSLGTKIKLQRARMAGWDVRLSAPKDFSVLWGIAPDEFVPQLEILQRIGTHAAMSYLSEHAVVGRRMQGGVSHIIPLKPLITGIHHATNRNHEPHLHSHCLVFADGLDSETNKLRALHSPWLYRHYRAAQAVHRATMRYELARLVPSVDYRNEDGQWRITSIYTHWIKEFSTRSLGVRLYLETKVGDETAIAELKRNMPHAYYALVQEAVFATRREKNYRVSSDNHRQWWRDVVEEGIVSIRQWWRDSVTNAPVVDHTIDEDALIAQAIRAVSTNSSTWTREDLVVAICDLSPYGIASVSDLERMVDTALGQLDVVPMVLADLHGNIITAETRSVIPSQILEADKTNDTQLSRLRARYTTRDILRTEQRFLQWAEHAISPATQLSADQVRIVSNTYIHLSQEQLHAVDVMTQSPKACVIVRGAPGSGKTYMLRTAVHAWESLNIPVFAVGFTGRAASELLQAAQNASTIHSFLTRAKHGHVPAQPFVVICDEASMTSTDLLDELKEVVREQGGRLVLVGDHRQLPSVSAGGLFSHHWLHTPRTGNDLVDGRAELRAKVRQVTESMREFVASLERNDVQNAMTLLYKKGDLVIGDDEDSVLRRTAKEWAEATLSGESTALLALRNQDVARLNLLARSYLLHYWKQGYPSSLTPLGKIVAPGLNASISHPSVGYREYRVGEVIICLDNARLHVGSQLVDIKNSWSGKVLKRTSSGVEVLFDHDQVVRTLPLSYLQESTDYGYARTVYKSQGMTIGSKSQHGTVFLFRPEVLSANAAWVAATRATHQLRLYVATKAETKLPLLDDLNKHGIDADKWTPITEPDAETVDPKVRQYEVEHGMDIGDEIDDVEPLTNELNIETAHEVIDTITNRWRVGVDRHSTASIAWQLEMSRTIAASHTLEEIDAEIKATAKLIETLPSLISEYTPLSSQCDNTTIRSVVELLASQLDDVLETTRSYVPLKEAVITIALDDQMSALERYVYLMNAISDTHGANSEIVRALLRLKAESQVDNNFDVAVNTLKDQLVAALVETVLQHPDFAIQLAERKQIFLLGKDQRHEWDNLASPSALKDALEFYGQDVTRYLDTVDRDYERQVARSDLAHQFKRQEIEDNTLDPDVYDPHINALNTSVRKPLGLFDQPPLRKVSAREAEILAQELHEASERALRQYKDTQAALARRREISFDAVQSIDARVLADSHEPVVSEPVVSEPAPVEPVVSEPAPVEPVVSEPVVSEPVEVETTSFEMEPPIAKDWPELDM